MHQPKKKTIQTYSHELAEMNGASVREWEQRRRIEGREMCEMCLCWKTDEPKLFWIQWWVTKMVEIIPPEKHNKSGHTKEGE